jgi:phage tail-like protein
MTTDLARPFTAFNFRVKLTLPDSSEPFCKATFAECAGLEMTMSPKTIQEGGNNHQQIHLIGPVGYGQLSLKRGMTPDSFELWDWFDRVLQRGEHGLRASGLVEMLTSDRLDKHVTFELTRCLPVKLRAPPLNAKDGLLAIEEMQIVYEMLTLRQPAS